MFEGQSQADVDAMLKRDRDFRRLYHHHRDLDKRVMDAELGVLPIHDAMLSRMKKEKLAAKEELVRRWDSRHH